MKLMKILALGLLVTVVLSTTAFAYIDPSVATYLIQVVAGIVIAIGTGVGVYFYRIKKKINQVLDIDENAKKEVEETIEIYEEEKK